MGITATTNHTSDISKKTVWMIWFQGVKNGVLLNAPHPVYTNCVRKWHEINIGSEWNLKVITKHTVTNYIPEWWDMIKEFNVSRIVQHRADLLRLMLLERYGGVWTDATVYPIAPIEEIVDEYVNHTDFFAFRYMPRDLDTWKKHGRKEINNCFIMSPEPGNYLVQAWLDKFKTSYSTVLPGGTRFPYHQAFDDLCTLYDSDDQVKNIIDNMVQVDEKYLHCFVRDNNPRYKDIKRAPVECLVYKKPWIPSVNKFLHNKCGYDPTPLEITGHLEEKFKFLYRERGGKGPQSN